MGKLADFYADLKITGDTLTLKTMVNKMSEMKLNTLGEITALGVMADILKNVAVHAMGTASAYTTLSHEFGINTDLLQRWQNVAIRSNVPIEAVAASFANVQKILAGFRQGQMNTGFMQGAAFLGIPNAVAMNYDQLFEVLRSRVPQLIKQRGRAFTTNALGMMGIDPQMIQMLELSRKQFQGREAGVIMSDAQIRKWTELNVQMQTFNRNLQLFGQNLESQFIGPLNKLLEEAVQLTNGGKKTEELGIGLTGGGAVLTAFGAPEIGVPMAALGLLLTRNRPISQTNHNKTDVHVHGGDAESHARQIKKHLDRQQKEKTEALLQLNGAVQR